MSARRATAGTTRSDAPGETTAWGVLIADIIDSKRVDNLKHQRDRLLEDVGASQRSRELVRSGYAITAFDEFQALLGRPQDLPQVAWELRLAFKPMDLRVGLGVGTISHVPREDEALNAVSMGEAFFRARKALEALSSEKEKYPVVTRLESGLDDLDLAVNLAYGLLDSLLEKTTSRQWETITAYEKNGRLETAARRLGIDESTVSRNLQRGAYWQTQRTIDTLRDLIESHTRVQPRRLGRESTT